MYVAVVGATRNARASVEWLPSQRKRHQNAMSISWRLGHTSLKEFVSRRRLHYSSSNVRRVSQKAAF